MECERPAYRIFSNKSMSLFGEPVSERIVIWAITFIQTVAENWLHCKMQPQLGVIFSLTSLPWLCPFWYRLLRNTDFWRRERFSETFWTWRSFQNFQEGHFWGNAYSRNTMNGISGSSVNPFTAVLKWWRHKNDFSWVLFDYSEQPTWKKFTRKKMAL